MINHDQLFKDLFRSLFPDLAALADADPRARLARALGPGAFKFLDKEVFQDFPEGRRHEVDLLVEVPKRRGRPTFLIHVEIEREYRADFGRRLKRYSYQLHLRHAVPIVSIVVFLRGGRPGAHWVERPERVLGMEIQRFRYLSLGLSGLPAEDLLDRPEPLAWALAALARPGRIGRARLKIELLRKIATATIGEAERFLLTNCIETYLQLTGREAKEYLELRRAQMHPEIEAMEMTWADRLEAQIGAQYLQKGVEQGLEQGLERAAELLRHTLVRQLGQRFGEVSPRVRTRIEAIGSLDELGGLADRILEVESIEELGLGN
ncbi:MAG TPA: hypothetical protein VN851_08100 [Thermoanaerobaculia bacterium]|nr:hypothetical protein [Thermoanaerobaculia bacterium]